MEANQTSVAVPADTQQADKFFVVLPKDQRGALGVDGAASVSFTLVDEAGNKIASNTNTFRGPKP